MFFQNPTMRQVYITIGILENPRIPLIVEPKCQIYWNWILESPWDPIEHNPAQDVSSVH